MSPLYDLWSLGVVILEVLIGSDIVEMMDSDQKVRAVLDNARQIIPGDLLELVERMTIYVDLEESKKLMAKADVVSEENITNMIGKIEDQRYTGLLNGQQLLDLIKYKSMINME